MTAIECHPTEVAAVINELHVVAETVRTFGDLGSTPGHGRAQLGGMPTQLYLVAAAVEAQMRALLYADQLCASRLLRLLPSPDDPARSVLHFALTVTDTVVVGAVSAEVCIAELTEAHRRLTAAATRLRKAMKSPALTPVLDNLDAQAEHLRVFVASFA